MRAASLIITAWVVLGPVACQVWKVTPVTPTAVTGIQGNPRLIRLTLDNGTVVTLQSPRIERDSIYGLIAESQTMGDRIAFPLSHVRQMDQRQMSAGRTAALLAGIVAAAVVTFVGVVVIAWQN
ncbi:MAG TPA: hypothetical protein VGJ64_04330 [Gemmatimonadaceae bacterium]